MQLDALKSKKLDKKEQQHCHNISGKNKATIQLFNSEIQRVNKLFKNIISDQQIFSKFKKKGPSNSKKLEKEDKQIQIQRFRNMQNNN